jgi:hypothetical protein
MLPLLQAAALWDGARGAPTPLAWRIRTALVGGGRLAGSLKGVKEAVGEAGSYGQIKV